MMTDKIISLCMERQFLSRKANEEEYIQLYRDMQPGQNVYWNGFGDPPSLTFRANFNDIEFNRQRQASHELIKGRFAGGNLGWIVPEDLELFAALYIKPLKNATEKHLRILELIEREGPLNIQQMKEETWMLVKEITPVLHRLQEAFLIYEDQYDGEWDRGWYKFSEIFPNANLQKYTRHEALKIILQRFAYRHVLFDTAMAKSFYKLPEKEIKTSIAELVLKGVLTEVDDGYMLSDDIEFLQTYKAEPLHFVYAMHRNDFLYKSNEHILKEQFKPLYENLPYDHESLQYLLIDGEFHGASVGHFRNGPYDLNDVVCDLPEAEERKDEIIEAITTVNYGRSPARFMGKEI
jgi:transcription initiation factor IIE alpha subunit